MVGIPAGYVIVPTMKMSTEMHDLLPSRVGPSQSQGHQGGLCSGIREAHPFRRRDHRCDQLGAADFGLSSGAEMSASVVRRVDRGGDDRVMVAKDESAMAPEIVDVPVSVDVPLHRSLSV